MPPPHRKAGGGRTNDAAYITDSLRPDVNTYLNTSDVGFEEEPDRCVRIHLVIMNGQDSQDSDLHSQ